MGMHGVGRGLCQVQLTHLLPHIARDERDGGLHFGHHALGFRDPLQARRAEAFLVSNGANRVDVLLDIPRNELAVATHTTLQVHKVVGVADGAHALRNLLALPGEPLVLVVCSCPILGVAFSGRPGPRFAGSPLALARCSCTRLSVSSACATALAAARCLTASGAVTALLSSCCTWKRSGE